MSTIAMIITGAAAIGFLLVLLADYRVLTEGLAEEGKRLVPEPRGTEGDAAKRAA